MNIHISGNLSKPTVIFIAGWPDTCDVFRDNLMATLAKDYRIVGLTLPGFDDEQPFLEELRKRSDAAAVNELRKRGRGRNGLFTACAATGPTWLSRLLSLRSLTCSGATPQSDDGRSTSDCACANTALRSFGLPCRCTALEAFRTSWKGHSFQDLVTLLEIAVDTAMETCNYCPSVAPPISTEARGRARGRGGGEAQTSETITDAFAAHQLPPTYTRPVLIAHSWGCLVAYELLLARPDLFSRIVALDVGAYFFESDAPHVERMCALVPGHSKGSPIGTAGSCFAEAEEQVTLNNKKPATWMTSGREAGAIVPTTTTGDLNLTWKELRLTLPDAAPTHTGPQRERTAPFNTVLALSPLAQMHSGHSTSGTKRSLASQYAIRRRKGAALPQGAEAYKRMFIVFWQFFLIACELLVPYRLARWLVGWLATVSGRPSYTYDPQMVMTPTMELVNQTLNAQFFARHPFAIENRGALQVPMLLQTNEYNGSSSSAATEAATVEAGYCKRKGPAQATSAGWKIMLIPYVERRSPTAVADRETSCHQGHLQSHRGFLSEGEGDGPSEGNRVVFRKLAHSTRARRHLFYDEASTGSSTGSAEIRDTWDDSSVGRHDDVFEKKCSTDGAHIVFSSYAKGAHMLFDEWNSLSSCTSSIFDGVPSGLGTSGELDPYVSANSIDSNLGAVEHPLNLTGAQSFMETVRATRVDRNEGYLSMAADRSLARDVGHTDSFGVTSSAGARHMRVAKRRLFYQALVFPPLNTDATASSSSLFHGRLEGSNLDRSFPGRCSTVLSRSYQSSHTSPHQASVPVRASPWHSWICLRFLLGTLVLRLVALVSWLLGEKKPTQPSPVSSDGTTSWSATGAPSKASSNVMTTAMTTIYRRLPAKPSLAADVSTLPGNGDVVLQPKSYAPLVTQRYFVPLPIPVLFMYGGEKRAMLHADHWCSYIRQYQRPRDGISDVVEVQGGGHWFFAEKKYQKKVADRIAEFLAAEAKTMHGL
ncbi:hypothetical protein, conserved [Leishmania tarentolae]|uniref:Uncharacterized protein n=1 Tax=Leishmania tarentolae TaxID=5689 RepID=A0A640KW21_LEITA|nr:hypothetical protein, conserved [Leishmania tarentolae]